MILESWKDPVTRDHIFKIVITDIDIFNAYPIIRERYSLEIEHFTRANASIEEKLMALQIYARILEERHESLTSSTPTYEPVEDA